MAGKGEPLTLVATDVEGSTDLWEWDKDSMMEAISIHDLILRAHLAENHGYEVATEVRCQGQRLLTISVHILAAGPFMLASH